jgi:hypothetical protein
MYTLVTFVTKAVNKPVPVAALSKKWVCGRSPADVVDSSLDGGVDVCLF